MVCDSALVKLNKFPNDADCHVDLVPLPVIQMNDLVSTFFIPNSIYFSLFNKF